MLMRHLPLPLPMDTNSSDERNILSGGATMPVPYHLDESDSDSIVSSEDATSYTELMNVPMTNSGAKEEVKLGLRKAIKTRRVAQGLEGLPVIEEKRPKIETLSFEEEERRRIRRERNKVAAFKCRQRRKEHMQKLQDESDELDNENSALETELAALKAQRDQLESMLRKHKCLVNSSSNESASLEQLTDVKSPHGCSAEVKPTTPTSSAADSVKA
ncbi:bZIP Maf transcription factor [Porites harrisoni]